jgi:hypothetical protein
MYRLAGCGRGATGRGRPEAARWPALRNVWKVLTEPRTQCRPAAWALQPRHFNSLILGYHAPRVAGVVHAADRGSS